VSGADPIEVRPGFTALLARIAGNGVRTIIVEIANRFARDLMVQEVGFAMPQGLGITLIAADSPASFLDDGPTSKLIRQILGAVSEFDKAMIIAKLRGARERVRRTNGKCEGRKSYTEAKPELVALAKQLPRVAAAVAARHIGRAIRQGLCNASRQTLFGKRRAIHARLIAITLLITGPETRACSAPIESRDSFGLINERV
jgi:DNA invertase Pin-like site-specific DNA recombinase